MGYRYKLGIDFGTTNSSIALRYAPEMKELETVVFDADPHNKGMESLLPSLPQSPWLLRFSKVQ